MSFNLNKLALKETAIVHLTHPDSEEKLYVDMDTKKDAVTVTISGTASKAYRQAILDMQNRSLQRGNKKVSAQVMREEGINLLVLCSVTSTNLEYNDEPVNTAEKFRELYSDPSLEWVKTQIDAALALSSNFL